MNGSRDDKPERPASNPSDRCSRPVPIPIAKQFALKTDVLARRQEPTRTRWRSVTLSCADAAALAAIMRGNLVDAHAVRRIVRALESPCDPPGLHRADVNGGMQTIAVALSAELADKAVRLLGGDATQHAFVSQLFWAICLASQPVDDACTQRTLQRLTQPHTPRSVWTISGGGCETNRRRF